MATLPYIQQRFHPRLKIGYTALVEIGKKTVPVHCRQGEIDGACGTYSAASALTILGKISDPARLADRRSGVAARLWSAARKVYFDGIGVKSLADLLVSLDAGLRIEVSARSHTGVLEFTQSELDAGRLVLLAWRTRRYTQRHWVLVVGVEGVQVDDAFAAQTYLCLDPGSYHPQLCGYNGRLEFSQRIPGHSSKFVRYFTADAGGSLSVSFSGAVSIGTID